MGGEEVSLFTIGTTTTTPATATAAGTYVNTVINKDASLVSVTGKTVANNVTIPSVQTLNSSTYSKDMFSVETNVGNGGTYTFDLNFQVGVLDGAEITLTSINVDFFAHNANGIKQNQDMECYATLTLSKDGVAVKEFDKGKIDITFSGSSNYTGKAYDNGQRLDAAGGVTSEYALPLGVKLDEGDYTLSIAIERSKAAGTYIGIGNVEAKGTVSQVPEPATGTLSLLALAGLCARRRRK